MPRTSDPTVRTRLIERAAQMLRTREPITLRSLVAGTGVSTMAVYTHFGGMDGVWTALRQEGFTRLEGRLERVAVTDDPVLDLTALTAAYLANALEHPDLYRVMFDATFALEDAGAALETLEHLVRAAERGVAAGRFRDDADARTLVTRTWVIAHGLGSLVASRALSRRELAHGPPMLVTLFTGAGDAPGRCERSVAGGWRALGG